MSNKKASSFPKRFLWGVSTSAHQVEGGTHNQWTVWELENAKSLAAQAEYQLHDLASWPRIQSAAKDPDNYVSGRSTDHYNRYEEDLDIAKGMNLNAFRFSIEWSRIEPKEGVWDNNEFEHYRRYVAAIKERGMEPLITLFHFTLPVWFSEKGGFERKANIRYFTRFAEKVIDELGQDLRLITTINEPDVYTIQSYYHGTWPPAKRSAWLSLRVYRNLASAHNTIAKILHAKSRRFKVGVAENSSFFYPGDDAWLSKVSAYVLQWVSDDYFLRKIAKQSDFIGLNYYFSDRVYGYRIHNPNAHVSDLGWDLSPENIEFVLERLYGKYKLPIIVTESGLADATDAQRKWWISHTLIGIRRALDLGVPVNGYLHWSLLDNFEWAYGKWPRFGLVEVDYKTLKRKIRPSGVWYGKLVKKMRLGNIK